MKKTISIVSISLLSIVFLFSACVVQSVKPFCSDEDAIKVPELEGKWRPLKLFKAVKQDCSVRDWEISEDKIICFDEENVESTLQAKFFRVGEELFVNVIAGDPGKNLNVFWKSCIRPMNTAAKIIISGDELKIIPADAMNLKEKLESGELKAEYTRDAEGFVILTGDSSELKELLAKVSKDEKIFNPEQAFIFNKVKTE